MPRRPAHILVVLEPGSKHQPALERGAWLAERTGAALELFACDYDQDFSTSQLFDGPALEHARRRLLAAHRRTLDGHAKRLAARGLRVRADVRFEHPLDAAVARKAAESGADLVLKSTRYHAELGRSFFSAVDWGLMTSCPANLWLVKPRALATAPKILAAIDPRHASCGHVSLDRRILTSAVALERALGGELHVLHGYDVSSALALSADALKAPISAPVRDLHAALQRRHRSAVLELTDEHSIDGERVHVHEGPVRQLLVAWTREMNVDLLAIGAVSRSGLPRTFIGSTAGRVLDEVPCDLLIVPP